MTKEEELEQAVATRNANRKAKDEELPKIINEFLGNTLARAIAQDDQLVSIAFNRENVSEELWEELNTYGTKTPYGKYHKNLMDLIVEDVYKPYLSDYSISIGHLKSNELSIRIKFYLNQD